MPLFPPPPGSLSVALLLLSSLSLVRCSCDTADRELLSLAFSSVSGFPPPPPEADHGPGCPEIQEVRLPSRNLTSTVSWMLLRNISTLRALDLSGNTLEGSVPGRFWSAPALVEVNLAANRLGGALRFDPGPDSGPHPLRLLNVSGNRFTSAVGLSGFAGLRVLDLSRNDLRSVPLGLESLHALRYLDVSHNSIAGDLPSALPPLDGLGFLNVSYNNFTGRVDSRYVSKFGSSAFIKAGNLSFTSSVGGQRSPTSSSSAATYVKKRKAERALRSGVIAAVCVVVGMAVLGCVVFVRMRRRARRKGQKAAGEGAAASQEESWVAEASPEAPVVVFEKPLMELTFSDLAAATSGFGRESQLAEGGRSGPAYRAVLPGDMHVVVRVLESARDLAGRDAVAAFRELGRLRHPNLLPLLGYCIAGREKLLLYEYMERGDLHRWLHELPAGKPNVEDWSGDTWEHHNHHQQGEVRRGAAAEVGDWPTRHRIALGVARGLAFLHQGWAGTGRPVVHGNLVPSNVLLGEDLEPRVADFAAGAGGASAEGDVHSFGVVVLELVTGRTGWEAEGAVGWARGMVRAGRGTEAVDPRLRAGGGGAAWEREMVECLRVGYLCTAESPEKRPTMQQVVGLLKDIRPSASSSTTTTTTNSSSC